VVLARGEALVVAEKMTNRILVFPIGGNGLPGPALVHPSAGVTPFGFAFGGRDELVVSEAFCGAIDASAVSSYILDPDGSLATVSASVPTTERAACWIAIAKNGRYAYTTNTDSDTVTGYFVAPSGALSALDADGVTAQTGDAPTDLDFSRNGRFLDVLDSASGTISAFRFLRGGSLAPIGSTGGLPAASPVGLAAM
jgi:6-phosphogluconolactonase